MTLHSLRGQARGSVALVAALLFAAGCGVGKPVSSPPQTNTYAYVVESDVFDAYSVEQFQLSNTGSLTSLAPNVAVDPYVSSLAVDSPGGFAFVGSGCCAFNGTIQQFVIAQDGTLTPNTVPESKVGTSPTGLTYVPNCHCAIGTDNNAGTITSFDVSVSGNLTPVNTVPAGYGPFLVAVHPTGRFAFVATEGSNGMPVTLSEFSIDQNGWLTLVNSLVTKAGFPAAMVMSPRGFLYYVPNPDQTPLGPIIVYSVDPAGGDVNVVNSISTGPVAPGWIAFDPTGSYAYLNHSYSMSQFTVDPTTGALTPNGPDLPISAGTGAADPSGQFLLVTIPPSATNLSFGVSTFAIGADGTLTQAGTVQLPNNSYPSAIVFAQRPVLQ
jgi:6-phosphogluconolactonase (cycloisomerase 2 family)